MFDVFNLIVLSDFWNTLPYVGKYNLGHTAILDYLYSIFKFGENDRRVPAEIEKCSLDLQKWKFISHPNF